MRVVDARDGQAVGAGGMRGWRLVYSAPFSHAVVCPDQIGRHKSRELRGLIDTARAHPQACDHALHFLQFEAFALKLLLCLGRDAWM